MRSYRILTLAVVATFGLFIAGSASAVSMTMNIDAVFTSGFAPSGTVIIGPSSISNLNVGDFIQLSVDIENASGEQVNSIFSTLTIDPALVSLFEAASSFATEIFFVPAVGFPTPAPAQLLNQVGAGPVIKVASLPAGDQIQAMAFASGDGSVGAGPDIAASTIFLEVTALGTLDVSLGFFFSNDLIQLNGVTLVGVDAAAQVPVNNPTISITVPEPNSSILGLAGLTTVFGIVSARRRRA